MLRLVLTYIFHLFILSFFHFLMLYAASLALIAARNRSVKEDD